MYSILFIYFFFFENRTVYEMWENDKATQASDDNMP